MPQLPSNQHYIFSEETEFEAPVSELLMQNIGESINYLNDLFLNNLIVFSSIGVTNWTVPDSVTKILCMVAPGGGGGGGGNLSNMGGAGGAGCPPTLAMKPVSPGQILAMTVGAGGAGGASVNGAGNAPNGATGGDSSITNVTGAAIYIAINGCTGGQGARAGGTTAALGGAPRMGGVSYSWGGDVTTNLVTPTYQANNGDYSIYAARGNGGGASGGGGGGGGWGNGGAGGANLTGGSNGGISAGGGGAGRTGTGFGGGDGGNGIIIVSWF